MLKRQTLNVQDERCVSQERPTSNQHDPTTIVRRILHLLSTVHRVFNRPRPSSKQAPKERNHRYFHFRQRKNKVLGMPYRKVLFTAPLDPFMCQPSRSARLRCKWLCNRMSSLQNVSRRRAKTDWFWSRVLLHTEEKYSAAVWKGLAVVWALKRFAHIPCTRSSHENFSVYSDHVALHWLLIIKEPSGRSIRRLLRLAEFGFEVK